MKGYGVRGVGHALAVALLAATSNVSITVAQAQQQTAQRQFSFNIPAKPVTQAVNDIGRITGLSVAFRENQAITANGNPVRGSLTAQQALSMLLAGTGLTYRFSNASTVQIYDPSAFAANGAAISEDGSLVLDTITVQGEGGRLPEPFAGGQVARGGNLGVLGNVDIMDAPFSQTSYTAKHVKDQQAQSLIDLIASDPSTRAASMSANFVDIFHVRGFSPYSAAESTVNGLPGMSPIPRVPVELFERVDILKGPSAFLFGVSNAVSVGGIANLTTKRATSEPINSINTDFTSYSSFGTHVDFGRRFGTEQQFGVRANGVLRGGDVNVDDVSRKTGAGALGLDYNGDRFRASFDALFSREVTKGAYGGIVMSPGVRVPRPPRSGTNPLPNDGEYDRQFASISGRAEYDINDDWTVYASIGHRWAAGQHIQGTVSNLQSDGGFLPYLFQTETESKNLSGQAGIQGKFSTGILKHNIIVNYAYHSWKEESAPFSLKYFPYSNIYNPRFISSRGIFGGVDLNKNSDQTFTSYTFSDTVSLLDDRVAVTVGARYQDIRIASFNNVSEQKVSSYNVDAVTPMVGLVFKPWDRVSIYGSYIEGLSTGFKVTDTLAPNYGSVLPPQKTEQYEAGLKFDLDQIGTTLAVFQISEPSIASDPYTREYSVNGLKRVRGIEWSVFGEIRPDLRVLGGVTFMEGVQQRTAGGTNNGKSSPGVPQVQANLGIEWDTPWVEGLTLTARAIHTSSQYVNYTNTQKIPPWTRIDIGTRYHTKIGDTNLTLRGSVENVFDRSYWEGTNWGTQLRLSAPRTFRVSATVDF